MTFEEIFALFYTKYRGEETPPATTDPEWKIAVRNFNDALMRMQHFDDTKWNFLYGTLQTSTQVSPVLVRTLQTSVVTYTAPTDMAEPAGYVTFVTSAGARTNIPVIQPHEQQSISTSSSYAYFTGDENNGFVLHINPTPSTAQVGQSIDYVYYKKPTRLNATTETGTSVIPGGDPAFYYNHMLAQRFLDSRNFPAYQIAKRDAEEALNSMKLKNNSGTWYNSWTLMDTSGTGFGV